MLNKVMLIGNLGADPEVRYMPSGETVTNIRMATSRRWKDKQTGEQKEATEWHRVVFFNIGNYRLAEIAGEYLKKGSKIYVEGRIQTRKWQDNTGQDRYTTEIVGEQMQMLDSRAGGTANVDDNQQNNYSASAQHTPAQQQPNYQQQPQAASQFNQAPQPQTGFNSQAPNVAPQQGFNPPPVQQGQQAFGQSAPVQQPPTQQQPFNQQPQQGFNPPQQQTPASPNDDYEDDIPF